MNLATSSALCCSPQGGCYQYGLRGAGLLVEATAIPPLQHALCPRGPQTGRAAVLSVFCSTLRVPAQAVPAGVRTLYLPPRQSAPAVAAFAPGSPVRHQTLLCRCRSTMPSLASVLYNSSGCSSHPASPLWAFHHQNYHEKLPLAFVLAANSSCRHDLCLWRTPRRSGAAFCWTGQQEHFAQWFEEHNPLELRLPSRVAGWKAGVWAHPSAAHGQLLADGKSTVAPALCPNIGWSVVTARQGWEGKVCLN